MGRVERVGSRRAPLLIVCLVAGALVLIGISGLVSASGLASHVAGPGSLPGGTFVAAPPAGSKGADDLGFLPGYCGDEVGATIWTAYQNGINPDGSPGTEGGPTHSTLVAYEVDSGSIVQRVSVLGKVDGFAADPFTCRLVVTVNEDSNSSLAIVDPSTGSVHTFTYEPSPTVSGNGGTDSVAIWRGTVFVTHSNPNDTGQPTQYRVKLDWGSHVAHLTPLFFDDSMAKDALTGARFRMALTDPDTSYVMPRSSPSFAGSLATVSQGDGAIVFASSRGRGHTRLTELNVTDNKTGNVPPIDGLVVASASEGTLYVVDAKAGTIQALRTDGWPAGTVFVGEPNDNGNPLIGTLDLATGKITPLGNHLVSPKGLLFLPDHSDDDPLSHHGEAGLDLPLRSATASRIDAVSSPTRSRSR